MTKVNAIRKIKTYVIPRYLYRYRSLANVDRELDCIKRGHVYCANFRAMNDPMEGFYSESKLLEKSPVVKQTRAAIFSGKMHIRMCAFSEVFNHELMWAHYADQFSGVCIAYDFFLLRRYLKDTDDVSFTRLYYNEEVPSVPLSKHHNNHDETAKMILSYKNHRWLYEREWRMFSTVDKTHYENQRCIARVYIGARVRPDDQRKLERTLSRLKIPYQMQKLAGYKMTFERAQ